MKPQIYESDFNGFTILQIYLTFINDCDTSLILEKSKISNTWLLLLNVLSNYIYSSPF